MSNSPNNKKKGEDRALPEIARQYLQMQREEIELRREENALREKDIDNQYNYSMKSLGVQETLLKSAPPERRKDVRQWMTGGIFAFVLFAGFFIYLYENGHAEVATELIKILTSAAVGVGAGYGYGFHRGRRHEEKREENS